MFLAFQPHLYEQQKKLERQKSVPSLSSSASTHSKPPSLSSSSSSTATTPSPAPPPMPDTRIQDEFDLNPLKTISPSPNLFLKRLERKRAATIVTDDNLLNRKQSNHALKSTISSTSSSSSSSTTEKKPSRGRSKRPSSARPASSGLGSAFDDISGRFFSIIPPIKTSGFALPPAIIAEDVINKAPAKKISQSGSIHVSIPLHTTHEDIRNSSGSQPTSASHLTTLDGLGISQFLDAFPTPEEDFAVDEPQDVLHYPLPIRLGVMRLGQLPRSARKKLYREQVFPAIEPPIESKAKRTSPQYCNGYYLCTAPPIVKEEKVMTSPDFYSPEAPLVRRGESPRRNRSDDQGSSIMSRDASDARGLNGKASMRGGLPTRWKLEQYFRSYHRKTCFGTKNYKFHAYDVQEACYWWGYNVKTMIAETLNHSIVTATAGLTILDWSTGPPSRVLDIGTGCGAWVIDSARKWTETEFIGLDLVPIQTPLNDLSDEDLQNRISWIVGNALQGLPFPDNSFDYVHIRKLNIGIPEEKWGDILSEAIRVLNPNGNLEIMETDWTFIGSPKEMLTSDLQDLVANKGRANQNKMKMWKRPNSNEYENLGVAVNAMLKTRMVKSDPASAIPFHLMNLEVHQLSQGQPRHFPILARSSKYESVDEESDKEMGNPTKPWSPQGPSVAMSFTMRPQIGLALPPHRFQIDNQDVFRMAILVSDVIRISEARDMIWDDLQIRQKKNLPVNRGTADEDGSIISSNNIIGPWKHQGDFEKEMDDWYTDLIGRADLEILLKSTLNWNEAASRMDNRIHQDQMRRRDLKRRAMPIPIPDCDLQCSDSKSLDPDSTITPLVDIRRLSKVSDGCEDEDQSTAHEDVPSSHLPFSLTTPILAFRTTTVFAAKKKP